MYLTGKRLSRRTMLRGAGAALLLPALDAMAPSTGPKVRLICIEMVHGAAGPPTAYLRTIKIFCFNTLEMCYSRVVSHSLRH